jgi:hypothetical protein
MKGTRADKGIPSGLCLLWPKSVSHAKKLLGLDMKSWPLLPLCNSFVTPVYPRRALTLHFIHDSDSDPR